LLRLPWGIGIVASKAEIAQSEDALAKAAEGQAKAQKTLEAAIESKDPTEQVVAQAQVAIKEEQVAAAEATMVEAGAKLQETKLAEAEAAVESVPDGSAEKAKIEAAVATQVELVERKGDGRLSPCRSRQGGPTGVRHQYHRGI